jgi:hypothetical protein
MIKRLLVLLVAGFMQQASAQEAYKTIEIPATLKQRANAVIRNMETTVDMRAADQVLLSVKKVITVLNENGDEDAALQIYYSKNSTIKGIKGEIYDDQGKLSLKFNQNNFKDESAISRYSLFEDDRCKYYQPQMVTYPYTVVYEYTIRNKQNLLIPDWYVNPDPNVAVELSRYQFICKLQDKVNIKSYYFQGEAKEKKDEKLITYTWEAKNIPAYRAEPYSPTSNHYLARIKIAPEKFFYYNFSGSYANWHDLGKWMYDDLIENRQTLAPATVMAIKDLVNGISSPKEKARKIYEFVQKKTRYVSVQVGIGGFQPTQANEVDQLGYGDCKGLVNYMQSLLRAVDIPSYYCIVNAGSQKMSLDKDFASMNQANHVILCLPFEKDTTWLECTSQTAPFGFLGDFTDDRIVLACTKEGGKLLRSPELKTSQNLTSRSANLLVDKDGSITGTMTTKMKGAQYDNNEYIIAQPLEEQIKSMKKKYDVDNINFSNVEIKQLKEADPVTEELCKMDIKNYVSMSQNRAYLVLNPFNKKNTISEVTNRTKALYINRGYTDQDIITYQLPDGFMTEAKPADVLIHNEYGSYSIKINLAGKTLTYTRTLVINNGHFEASKYAEFVAFISQVNRNDHSKMVFKVN